jgi:hypothetical protein
MEAVLASAPAKLAQIGEEQAAKIRIGHWSSKQILGHLIDSATNNHRRFVLAQIESPFRSHSYAQNEWVSVNHYQERRWADLVTLWMAYNRHLTHVMQMTPAEKLDVECAVAGDASGTLEFLMVDYVCHMEHHLNQILGGA